MLPISTFAMACLLLMACKDDRANRAQEDLDRAIERAGGIERDTKGRAYDSHNGKYLDSRGGTVAPDAITRRPGELPPEPPETDVTRGNYEEFIGSKQKALQLYKKACAEKVAGGCANVALMKRDKDPAKAEAESKQLCDSGDGVGCYALGIVYETARLAKSHDATEVIAVYDKGCALGSYDACNALGMVYHSGRGGAPKDPTKATEALQRGCELGDRQSCLQVGMVRK